MGKGVYVCDFERAASNHQAVVFVRRLYPCVFTLAISFHMCIHNTHRRWKPDAKQDMEYVFFKMDFRPPAFQPCCMSFKVRIFV